MVDRSRKWNITINNPISHNFPHSEIKRVLEDLKFNYWCMCDEIGKNGTPHTHIFVHSTNAKEFDYIRRCFNNCAHIENARGTCVENRDYIRKEGAHSDDEGVNLIETFEEFGELPSEQQGKRNDVKEYIRLIEDGNSFIDIVKEYPAFAFHKNMYDTIRKEHYKELFEDKDRELEVHYVFGDTGLGKTRTIFQTYGYKNVFRVTDYQHPFDEYDYQDIIVFEEFLSDLSINQMLNFLDRYPTELPCRFANKMAVYTKVYICTNIDLSNQFVNASPKSFNAFLRRITDIKYYYDVNSYIYIDKDKYTR